MKEYMKYVSDDYQEVIQIEEDPNGTVTIDKGFLPLIKVEDPAEDENTEYVAVKLVLGDDTIQYQMLQVDHGEESRDNIRIIHIQERDLLFFGNDQVPTKVIQKHVNWLKENQKSIEGAIQESDRYLEELRIKNGFEKAADPLTGAIQGVSEQPTK